MSEQKWYNKKCVICGNTFTTFKRNKFVDSIPCQQVYNRNYMRELMRKRRAEAKQTYLQTCIVCHKEFRSRKMGIDVICFDCKLAKRKIFERDRVDFANMGELKPVPMDYIKPSLDA
jgi:hypothetical protein